MATPEQTSALLTLSNDLASAIERTSQAIVSVNARSRIPSTGIHWRPGVVVTSDHTVEREDDITVTLPDGTTVPAKLAGRDASTDLAVLRLDGITETPAQIGDSSTLKLGQVVLAVGRPGADGLSASFGVISAISGPWRTMRGGQIDRFLRPDLTMYPGFSGGPLVDASGQIVGINTSQLTRGSSVTIPTSTVNAVLDQLLTKGHIARGYLGLAMQTVRLPDGVKSTLGLTQDTGLIAVEVAPGGPAAQGGLIIGDILITVGDGAVTSTDEVQSALTPERIGQPLAVRVIRAGALTTLNLTVGERPQREN